MLLKTVLLSVLLLQSPTQSPDTRFVDWFVRLLPIAISVYVWTSGRSREDRKTLDKTVADLVLAKETHQERIKGLQLEFEKGMDAMQARFHEQEKKLDGFGPMREDMAIMKTKLEGYEKAIDQMNRTLQNIETLLRNK